MITLPEYLFIAASPDCLVTCGCCCDGLLDVKSPQNIWHEKPTVQNLDYLEFDKDENIHLIENRAYFLERISFNGNFWIELVDRLTNLKLKITVPKV